MNKVADFLLRNNATALILIAVLIAFGITLWMGRDRMMPSANKEPLSMWDIHGGDGSNVKAVRELEKERNERNRRSRTPD